MVENRLGWIKLAADVRGRLGISQSFPVGAHAEVERVVDLLHALGVRHVRTEISWALHHRPEGQAWYEWYDWLLGALSDFETLVCVTDTPVELAEGRCPTSPPVRLESFADFVGTLVDRHGDRFEAIELWCRPNNRSRWAYDRFDPAWRKFSIMVRAAARRARACGKRTVLGGMLPVDHEWLDLMHAYGGLDDIDVIGIQGFPEMWWPHAPNWDWYARWRGWPETLAYAAAVARGKPVWITESGLSTWDVACRSPGRHALQGQCLQALAAAPAERKYWCSMVDLDPQCCTIRGFHVGEHEYHLGAVTHAGEPKPAWETLRSLMGIELERMTAVG